MNEPNDDASLHEQIDDLRVRLDGLAEQNVLLIELVRKLNDRLTYREKVLVGWKEIGEYLGIHERSACNMGAENVDPLPHEFDHRGNVVAYATALDAWKARRRRHAERVRGEAASKAAATRAGRAGRSEAGDPS